ncbi:uncharacterized protein [Aquarana catesbeiana]|uniref:uncharacterized protein isoform X1 n=2 Tax=Aquarana catesbeiana TaxID=8400 RepID=UPI003CC950A4
MSRRKEVVTLTGLCLQNIADNMQSVWMKDYMMKNMEEYNFLFIEGPFNQLAGSLVQELIRILGESHKLNKGCLHLLLQPHLLELSLRSCAGIVNVAIMQLVTVRCKHLTSLDLHSCNRVPAASLATLIEGLPRLIKLCLADTQCDSLVLTAIGRSCPRLCELDVSRCKKVSSSSLLSMVYDTKGATFCCQALRVLLLDDVKPKGSPEQWAQVLCFILLALPCLEELPNPSLSAALNLLYSRSFTKPGTCFDGFPPLAEVAQSRTISESKIKGGSNMRNYQLNSSASSPKVTPQRSSETSVMPERLTLRLKKLEDLEEDDVSVVGSLCPLVEEVAISLGDQPLGSWSLVQWPHLTKLTLHCPQKPERTLEEFLAALQAIGNSLQVLSLQNLLWCHDDSLPTLLTMCPNLQSFQSHFTVLRQNLLPNEPELPPWPRDPLPLPRLHAFSLLIEGEGSSQAIFQHKLGGSLVSVLKGSPQLESLSLCGVQSPLDSVFEVVYGSSPPRPLQRLSAVTLCGSNVTQWGASLVVRSGSDLRTLDLSHCKEVTCRDHHQLQERARKQRLNLTISWL